MRILIFGAGPLGSLYACLFNRSGKDVTILARNQHHDFIKENGIVIINEFTKKKVIEKVKVTNSLKEDDDYDLVIILMRKNSLRKIFPLLKNSRKVKNFLFMGNNALGFDEYLKFIPEEKILFGFPGGGGSKIDNVVHCIDSEKPNGKRLPVVLGEIDGKTRARTKEIQHLFESTEIAVKIVDDIDSWLKYHVAFINPLAGALLKAGDNYKLAKEKEIIRTYIEAVNEGGKVLRALGYNKSYNPKMDSLRWFPKVFLINILKQFFNSKFAEIAMMMHVNAAKDEMIELGNEFRILRDKTEVETPNIDHLLNCIK